MCRNPGSSLLRGWDRAPSSSQKDSNCPRVSVAFLLLSRLYLDFWISHLPNISDFHVSFFPLQPLQFSEELYFAKYDAVLCFWPKLSGKKSFDFLIQYFIYLYLEMKLIIVLQGIILHTDIVFAF